jgi:hypothetical protein
MQVYDLLIVEEFDHNGEGKKKFHNVGVAFEQKQGEGFNLTVNPGTAISGRVLMLPRKAKTDQ